MIDATENARLDALTAYCATILSGLTGLDLDDALEGVCKRRGRTDAALREQALHFTHPDDLVASLVSKGLSLASVGVDSVQLG